MAKLAKLKEFGASASTKEMLRDKTTRIVREIQEGENKQRKIKTARLRDARLEREADTAQKKPQSKVLK